MCTNFGSATHHQVTDATIGIIGMGHVGYQVAKRARHGFDMHVLYHSRTRKYQSFMYFIVTCGASSKWGWNNQLGTNIPRFLHSKLQHTLKS